MKALHTIVLVLALSGSAFAADGALPGLYRASGGSAIPIAPIRSGMASVMDTIGTGTVVAQPGRCWSSHTCAPKVFLDVEGHRYPVGSTLANLQALAALEGKTVTIEGDLHMFASFFGFLGAEPSYSYDPTFWRVEDPELMAGLNVARDIASLGGLGGIAARARWGGNAGSAVARGGAGTAAAASGAGTPR